MTLDGWKHYDLSTALDDGWGIATRDGCFCAQPLVADLLGVSDKERYRFNETEAGRKEMPGLVRAANSSSASKSVSTSVASL
jgi:selenocysteine lyase/cysteine desulfurase